MKRQRRLLLFTLAGMIIISGLGIWVDSVESQNKDRGWLGLTVKETSRKIQRKYELERGEGIEVTHVVMDSPADFADLENGDVILEINGTKLRSPGHLSRVIRKMSPGDKVDLNVIHDGKNKNLSVELTSALDNETDYNFFAFPGGEGIGYSGRMRSSSPYLGVHIQDMSEDLAKYFNVASGDGVLITDIEEDSPANTAGLKAGDIFAKIEGEEIQSTADVFDILREYEEGEEIELSVIRSGREENFKVTLEESRFPDFGRGIHTMPGPIFESLRFLRPNSDEFKIQIKDQIDRDLNRIIREEIQGAQGLRELRELREIDRGKLRIRIEPELRRLRDQLRSFEWRFELNTPIEIDSEDPDQHKRTVPRTI